MVGQYILEKADGLPFLDAAGMCMLFRVKHMERDLHSNRCKRKSLFSTIFFSTDIAVALLETIENGEDTVVHKQREYFSNPYLVSTRPPGICHCTEFDRASSPTILRVVPPAMPCCTFKPHPADRSCSIPPSAEAIEDSPSRAPRSMLTLGTDDRLCSW